MKLLIVSLFVFVFLCVQHSADAGVVDRIRLIFSSIKNNIDHRINRQNNYNSDNSNNNSNSSSNSTTTSYKGYSNRNYNSNSNKYYNSNDKNYVIQELQENLNICNDQIRSLKTIIQSTKSYTQSLRKEKDYQKRVYEKTIDELKVAHKNEIILMNNNINTTIANKYKDQMEKDQVIIREQITTELTTKHQQEIQAINKNHTKEIRLLRDELSSAKLSLSQSNATITDLRNKLKIQKSEHDKVVQDYQGKEKVAEKVW